MMMKTTEITEKHRVIETKPPAQVPCEVPGADWRERYLAYEEESDGQKKLAARTAQWTMSAFHRNTAGQRILVLQGITRCGKTHLATRAAQFLMGSSIDRMWDQWDTDCPPNIVYFTEDQVMESPAAMEDARSADVLVLDDIGRFADRYRSGEDVAALCRLMDDRLRPGRFTLITTNLHPAQWVDHWDERLASRLKGITHKEPISRVVCY